MPTQRTILWVIFSMSLLFLWDAWQREQGHASLFGGQNASAPKSAPGATAKDGATPSASGAPAAPADKSIPTVGA